jgi:hypothetical protein
MAKGKKQRKMKASMSRPVDPRYAANPLDYKKVILDRSVPDQSRIPRDPRRVYPRLRNRVAFANR